MECLEVFREWVTFAADVCILLITIFTFYIAFLSKKIELLSVNESYSIIDGNSISVVLENKTTSPMVITNISLIQDDQLKIVVKKFDSPLVLAPFTAEKIESEKFSYTIPEFALDVESLVVEVTTSKKTIFLTYDKKAIKVSEAMKNIHSNIIKRKKEFNGKIVPKMAKYVLTISKEDYIDTIFIFENGRMTGDILGCSAIHKDNIKDINILTFFFKNWLEPSGIKFEIYEINNNF